MGIPFVADLSRVPTAYFYDWTDSGNAGSYELSLRLPGVRNLATAVLLGILYPRVRNIEQAIVRLVWSYALVLATVSAPVYFGAVLLGYASLWQLSWVYTLSALLSLLPLLWFARRASRLSLAHAFFLVFIVGGLTLPNLPESLPFYFRWIWGLAASILAVWLLANFDVRGPLFRRSVAAAVVVLEGLVYLPLLLLAPTLFFLQSVVVLLLFPLQLLLIYLVRVRQPHSRGPVGDRPSHTIDATP